MKKILTKIFNILFSRLFILCFCFILQLTLVIMLVLWFKEYFIYFYSLNFVISVLSVLFVVDSEANPSYKIVWIICITALPIFGVIAFLLFSGNRLTRIEKKRLFKLHNKVKEILDINNNLILNFRENNRNLSNQLSYIKNYVGYPTYKNTQLRYFPLGEDMHKALLEELKKAEKFIFMEYFIISKGKMWSEILDILIEKAKAGVEIFIIYDDLGSFFTLKNNYPKELEKLGIKCRVFNKINPIFTIVYNNRSHRKITVIDNKVAFTGGINIADEYINHIKRFGHWKDTAIMLKGEAVWSFTVMFLAMWDFIGKSNTDFDNYKLPYTDISDGYCVPFTDSPFDNEIASETIYMNIINSAERYIYITTPYLILDHEMTIALSNAAKRGIDVRIITPHIPDKKAVFAVTRANYVPLLKSGVKIYEYTPGFIHAKSLVCDDKYSIIGSINLDFRSLYLHFECGAYIYNSSVVSIIKSDFISTQNKSTEIPENYSSTFSIIQRITNSILKIFSPLM